MMAAPTTPTAIPAIVPGERPLEFLESEAMIGAEEDVDVVWEPPAATVVDEEEDEEEDEDGEVLDTRLKPFTWRP